MRRTFGITRKVEEVLLFILFGTWFQLSKCHHLTVAQRAASIILYPAGYITSAHDAAYPSSRPTKNLSDELFWMRGFVISQIIS